MATLSFQGQGLGALQRPKATHRWRTFSSSTAVRTPSAAAAPAIAAVSAASVTAAAIAAAAVPPAAHAIMHRSGRWGPGPAADIGNAQLACASRFSHFTLLGNDPTLRGLHPCISRRYLKVPFRGARRTGTVTSGLPRAGVNEGVDAAGESGEAHRRGAPLAGTANSSPVETPPGRPATSCGRV